MNEAPHCWKNYREISGECRSCTYAEACRLCAATEARMRRPLGGQEFDSVANWVEELADCDHIPGVEPVPAREPVLPELAELLRYLLHLDDYTLGVLAELIAPSATTARAATVAELAGLLQLTVLKLRKSRREFTTPRRRTRGNRSAAAGHCCKC
ncbi:hypothetical protein [Victivallis vadensis]|uniref:hypothetical protein n=1 Tax=Victivallis vadensis TaxID=172901 RepID=UPI00307DD118